MAYDPYKHYLSGLQNTVGLTTGVIDEFLKQKLGDPYEILNNKDITAKIIEDVLKDIQAAKDYGLSSLNILSNPDSSFAINKYGNEIDKASYNVAQSKIRTYKNHEIDIYRQQAQALKNKQKYKDKDIMNEIEAYKLIEESERIKNTIEDKSRVESETSSDVDLDEINKQWYENKQKEFAERELEIQKEFSDVNTLKPEDVIGDTVEETIENTTENVLEETVEAAGETIAKEVIEEGTEKILKEVTGINVELDGLNKKRTPKKLKKGTGKYKAKTSTVNNEIYDRLDNSRYWAVDFPGSNGDFAVHGPNGTKRLEKEKIDQQRRKRKYEQTRQKYEKKQQQRQQQKQKDFVDNTIHIDDEIDLDEINKQWYESKQKEFEQKQKEIDDYFENNADIDPEDVLKDDYAPDVNKFTDDIDTLEKNFEQSKDFDINKGIDDALDAANKTVESTVREGGSISKYLKEFSNMGFFDKVQTLGAAAGAVSEYKNARRQGHGVISSVARAGVDFALGEAMGLYYPLFLLAKDAPGMIVKGSEMLYKENRKMNSMANQQIFGDAQFQDTQQLATMRQSGMEMAKMAQYNLQQTLMGNEATYFHR